MKTQLSTRRGHLLVRTLTILVVVVVGTAVLALPAAADPPVHYSFVYYPTAHVTDVCSFPVDQTGIMYIDATYFFDNNGANVRTHMHVVQEDTFTANDITLVGLPYTYNMDFLYDSSGNLTHWYSSGVMERIPLPDGGLFICAGRTDVVERGLPDIILSPDHGNPGNIAAFCAALAP
jgi:hypothetical protein